MKRKVIVFIYLNIILGVLSILVSCKKENENIINLTNGKTTAIFNSSLTYGVMKDQDGNIYKTITIGNQTWMAENLRTTKYNDGSLIQNVIDNSSWLNLTTGAYSNYNNTDNNDTIATFGRLYNWYAVNSGKLAPVGWHVPTYTEWSNLMTYLGGESDAGGKMKETGISHWLNPNYATNETGFTALPGGYRHSNGIFTEIGSYGLWWSSTPYSSTAACSRYITYDSGSALSNYPTRELGFSVRCVKN